ncbi:MAG: hypothetical protein HXY40_10420 [Chloroflexi bacterium]|nr:hypothetical protein [Chloroflexota bacterium]
MTPQPALATVLDFTAQELALNRNGTASARQLKAVQRGMRNDLGCMFFVLAGFALFFGAIALLCVYFIIQPLNPSRRDPFKNSGIIAAEPPVEPAAPTNSAPLTNDLKSAFPFTDADLRANRQGQLSPQQKQRLRLQPLENMKEHWPRWLLGWVIVSVVGTVLGMLQEGESLSMLGSVLPAGFLFGAIGLAFAGVLYVLRNWWLAHYGRVLSCRGTAQKAADHTHIVLDGLEFAVPNLADSYFTPGKIYQVYYLSEGEAGVGPKGGYRKTAPRVVSVEGSS